MERRNAWKSYTDEKLAEVNALCAEYMEFLDNSKTERECVDTVVNIIEKEGYQELAGLIGSGRQLTAGDKVYAVNKDKNIAAFVIGDEPLEKGLLLR